MARRPRLVASAIAIVAGGACYGLAQPPRDLAALAWVALVPLLLVVRGRPAAPAFGFGMVYGFACGAHVGFWLFPAIARFLDVSWPLAALLGTAYFLAFWSVPFGLFAAGAARQLASRRPVCAVLATAALWVATEFLRGRILGHPWGLLGYSQHAQVALIQVASATAVYGVSFLLVAGNAAFAEAIALRRAGSGLGVAFRPLLVVAVLTAVVWAGGALAEPKPAEGTRQVALVQTNVPPERVWSRAYTERQITEHMRMTDRAVPAADGMLIVWPENAVPRYLEIEPGIAALLASFAQRRRSDLLFGAPRYADGRSYNSVRLVTGAGRNGGYYDKQVLVLVAETNPLRPAASVATDETPRQFTPGGGPGVLGSVVPIGVTVCQEIMFPEIFARAVVAGAELLVNVANDGWLDPEQGVAGRQLFAMAAFRAVETRRYLVRAATTGVSGAFDPAGRVLESLPSGAAGVVLARVEGETTISPYVRLGDVFAVGCVVAAVAALLARWRAGARARRVLPPIGAA